MGHIATDDSLLDWKCNFCSIDMYFLCPLNRVCKEKFSLVLSMIRFNFLKDQLEINLKSFKTSDDNFLMQSNFHEEEQQSPVFGHGRACNTAPNLFWPPNMISLNKGHVTLT